MFVKSPTPCSVRATPAAHNCERKGVVTQSRETDGARIGFLETTDDVERRCLAGPVRTYETNYLHRLNVEGNLIQSEQSTEPDCDILQFHRCFDNGLPAHSGPNYSRRTRSAKVTKGRMTTQSLVSAA
jgi:hypothetical protein